MRVNNCQRNSGHTQQNIVLSKTNGNCCFIVPAQNAHKYTYTHVAKTYLLMRARVYKSPFSWILLRAEYYLRNNIPNNCNRRRLHGWLQQNIFFEENYLFLLRREEHFI